MNMIREKTRGWSFPAFLFATALVIYFYLPVLFPLIDGRLVFAYIDFTTIARSESAESRIISTYYTFVDGQRSEATNRAFLIEGVSFFSKIANFSDSQTQSIIILACLLLGSFGIYRLTKTFLREEDRPIAILFLIPFYFLNMWSIDRIIHIWIWFTYAIFPLFVSAGLSYIYERKYFFLVSYSLIFAFFGMIPHSFVYLLLVHLYLAIFSFISRQNLKSTLLFLLFPLFIYFLLNLPPLSLLLTTKMAYPQTVDLLSLQALSAHGELVDVLTFSNNWWPQVDAEKITENRILRFASLAIIAGTFAIFLLGYKKTGSDERTIALLALLFILGFVFVAQGTNNWLLDAFFGGLSEEQLQYAALFRESGRIVLMIPVFLLLTILSSANGLEEKERRLFFVAMLFLVFLHVFSSPIFEYMGTDYSATEVPGDYCALGIEIPKEYKTIWVNPADAPRILNSPRYEWNKEKGWGWVTQGIGSGYPKLSSVRLIADGNASKELFGALNVKYVIKRTDMWQGSGFNISYGWLECRKLEYITVCKNTEETKPFSVYPAGGNPAVENINETGEGQAVVGGFARINPTLWHVNISANGPFLLSFAETYDPFWEARVYSNGEKKETLRPVELFETINGYRINTTGDLEVELRYAPQDTFEAAAAVSVITLLSCIFYLIYSAARKEK